MQPAGAVRSAAIALVNVAWSRGLGAVINSRIMQSPVVREHAGIADDQVIMKSTALGWPESQPPIATLVSSWRSPHLCVLRSRSHLRSNSGDHVQLNRSTSRQLSDADGGACVATALAEALDQPVGSTIHDL